MMRLHIRLPWFHATPDPVTRQREEDARAEALSARQRAELDLERIRARNTEVSAAAARFREIRGANHFAQSFQELFRRSTS